MKTSTKVRADEKSRKRLGLAAVRSIAGVATQTGLVAGKITLSEEYSHDRR